MLSYEEILELSKGNKSDLMKGLDSIREIYNKANFSDVSEVGMWYFLYGNILYRLGKHADSIAMYEKAVLNKDSIDSNKNYHSLIWNLAGSHMILENYRLALTLIDSLAIDGCLSYDDRVQINDVIKVVNKHRDKKFKIYPLYPLEGVDENV